MENKIVSEKTMEGLRIACGEIAKVMKKVVKILTKVWDFIMKFVSDNPWIMTWGLNKNKFNKRAVNRNKLYIKRKKLGKKL
ncbi:hypothetical protein [Clostridium estertheticum]|uniref:Transposase n=1 Tax=Clostridium estertheticum subsp. estertheticum TaxID=1552 RepID=A0A1J0GKW9_9CLOT|nr:hypothetical protein [Clostridium estertheticum]APC41542.1 hypothetical protein A7L45_16385 [Clostridium estertheticum subsp. estertheticum]MBW9154248.1 hypothetical protein [Clostridium estertheticum]WLC86677.1 hypothetical protein KTC97_21885 [Clostridium estertheticum]